MDFIKIQNRQTQHISQGSRNDQPEDGRQSIVLGSGKNKARQDEKTNVESIFNALDMEDKTRKVLKRALKEASGDHEVILPEFGKQQLT